MPRRTTKQLSARARNIRAWRKKRGFTQEELALAAKISRSTLASIELDRWPDANSTTLISLARALGTTLNELIGVESQSAKPFIDAFLASKWPEALELQPDELAWLNTVSTVMWAGPPPEPESIAKLIQWHRDDLRKSGRT
jgi:transcriptional regulator with XRE-family HTH domain